MNFRRIARLLGLIADILGVSMLFSLPWAFAPLGGDWVQENAGFLALLCSSLICVAIGEILRFLGRAAKDDQILRRESIAVVPLSWILAILLAALPFLLSGTEVRKGVAMSAADAIFEATSGITTTGATVLANVEDPRAVPRTILFWRATTHFLGGLGIMVLLVILVGQGVAGKMMMNAELGAAALGSPMQIQSVARYLSYLYAGMALILTILLKICGLSLFDALCHAFSTLSTGGFSTYNGSVGHFATDPGCNGPMIEWTLIIFMILAGSNFLLLLQLICDKRPALLRDTEWRGYLQIILLATIVVFVSGIVCQDFEVYGTESVPIVETENGLLPWTTSLRLTVFHVVSGLTGTGFCLDEYERWNGLALLVFIHLMFIGGCSGSTAGGTKVIRNLIAVRTISQEIGRAHRPNLVQTVRVGKAVFEKETTSAVMTYLCAFLLSVFLVAFVALTFEPLLESQTPVCDEEGRVINALSASLSMHSNVGPAFGPFGAKGNYGFLCSKVKLLFSWAMLMGRLELYLPILLFSPAFWRRR